MPRRAGFRTGVAFDKNKMKSLATMQKYRAGFNLLWRMARKYMKRIGMKEPGKYDRTNQHGGKMFALPNEVSLSGLQAGKLLRKCYKRCATKSHLEMVRKCLSYAYQLTTGKDGNYEEAEIAWSSFDPRNYGQPRRKIMPQRVIPPERLGDAFTTEWSPDCGMSFPSWCVGNLLTWDWCVCGSRSGCDLEKVKQSADHQVNAAEGWMRTGMVGGRSKLERKKGNRAWYVYRQCICPEGKHKGIPNDFFEALPVDCNPTDAIPFCTTCPLNAFQFVKWALPVNDNRIYPRWLTEQNRYSVESVGRKKLTSVANEWLKAQGANPDDKPYCSNSGRKALAKWCEATSTPYRESFEIHGDLQKNWVTYYQPSMKADRVFRRRTQSRNPQTCLKALKRFAMYVGRGTPADQPANLSCQERMLALLARKLGAHRELAEILLSKK